MKQLRLWLWLLATTTTWENQTYHCSRHSHYYRSNQFRRSQRKAYIANTADTNEDQAKFFPGCISTFASLKDLKVPHAKPQLHSCCCYPCSLVAPWFPVHSDIQYKSDCLALVLQCIQPANVFGEQARNAITNLLPPTQISFSQLSPEFLETPEAMTECSLY